MIAKIFAVAAVLLVAPSALAQVKQRQSVGDDTIRISTELVQLDAVVLDKNGKVVRGLSRDDFQLFDAGKKQQIAFFEFVDASKMRLAAEQTEPEAQAAAESGRDREFGRIYAFIVDDLTIPLEGLVHVRDMLSYFIEHQMRDNDLVAVIRVAGGAGLLQQFTDDKSQLRKLVAGLAPGPNPYNVFNQSQPDVTGGMAPPLAETADPGTLGVGADTLTPNSIDLTSASDDTNVTIRGYMTLGTASFLIETMKRLPGRKAMVLISGGLPVLGTGPVANDLDNFLNLLADRATRAGVAVNTVDVRGTSAHVAVPRFADTAPLSSLTAMKPGFGRRPDANFIGYENPIDVDTAHMGLAQLAAATGGIAVLNRNDLKLGMDQIVQSNDAYYLLAYTPSEAKFNGNFHKVDIRVRGGYRVLSRRGYLARRDEPEGPAGKEQQMLDAIKSPLDRREIDLDAAVIYRAADSGKGEVDLQLWIKPRELGSTPVDEQGKTGFDVTGFVFDQFGKVCGRTNASIPVPRSEDYSKIEAHGLPYVASIKLPPGGYQVRIAVRDNRNQTMGTISRYVEVPDLSKGRLAMSSLLLGAVQPGNTRASAPTSGLSHRLIPRNNDLRYVAMIYNARQKNDAVRLTTQILITREGRIVYKEPAQPLASGGGGKSVVKMGQLGLERVKPGRYTATLVVTDELAEKRRTVSSSMDFIVSP
jgi:VWFA-related protein